MPFEEKVRCSPTLNLTLRGAGAACEAAWPCLDLAAACCGACCGAA